MTGVSTWRLFAYMDDDEDGTHDESRVVADWQLGDVLRWCQTRGYDHIYFTRTGDTTVFEKKPAPPGIVLHSYPTR